MKKVLVLIVILLVSNIANAQSDIEETKYCAVAKNTGNVLSKAISNVTGVNFVSTKAAELAIQKAIKAQLGSNTNVELYPYTIGSLIQGKFKKMTLEAKSLNLSGLYVSKFNSSTLCDYNQVGIKDNNLIFKENFVMSFSGTITQEDLKKTMESTQYLALTDSVRISLWGKTLFRMSSMNIGIKNNKLVIVSKVMSPILWGTEQKTISATSGLKIENGKIKYNDLSITDMPSSKYLKYLLSLINLVNPFTMEIKLSPYTTGYTSVKNVIINNNKINIDGILYILKNG